MITVESPLDFTVNMAGIDRATILSGAAESFDRQLAHLDSSGGTPTSAEGRLARALLEDAAEFAAFPDVYRITTADFKSGAPSATALASLADTHNFYWIYLPVLLRPQRNWYFNRLEVLVEFNPDEKVGAARPRVHQILPDKKFQTLLEANQSLTLQLDENLEFRAGTGPVALGAGPASAKVDVSAAGKAAAGAGFVAGPFKYTVKRARLDHSPVGGEKVFWRLDGADFFEDGDTKLVVIVQVPKEVKEVRLAGALQAYRYFKYAAAGLQDAVKHLAQSARHFFEAGAPLRHEVSWDLTPRL